MGRVILDMFSLVTAAFIAVLLISNFYRKYDFTQLLFILLSLMGALLSVILLQGSASEVWLIIGYFVGLGYLFVSLRMRSVKYKAKNKFSQLSLGVQVSILVGLILLYTISMSAFFIALTTLLGMLCSLMMFSWILYKK